MSTPLTFVFYVAVKPEKLWEGLFSPESNRIIFAGADFEADLKPGGLDEVDRAWDLMASPQPWWEARFLDVSLPNCLNTLFNSARVPSNLE